MIDFPKPKKVIADINAASIDELIAAYRDSIDLLRKECSKEIAAHKTVELADPNFGDDIYLLRYVLSHHKKGLEKAKGFLLKTIEYRAKHAEALLSLRRDLGTAPHDEKVRPLLPGGLHFCTPDGHVLFIIRTGIANPPAVMRTGVTSHDLCEWFVLTKEAGHAYCDAKTRSLGRLIKTYALQDFRGVSMTNFNRHFMNALAASSHITESIYPQLLRKSLIVFLPFLLRKATMLTIKLMPQGLQEKVGICPETDVAKAAAWVAKEFSMPARDLPTFLGGECNCAPYGCCNNTPNSHMTVLTEAEAKALPMDSWADYVQYKLGPAPVSWAKEGPKSYRAEDLSNESPIYYTMRGTVKALAPNPPAAAAAASTAKQTTSEEQSAGTGTLCTAADGSKEKRYYGGFGYVCTLSSSFKPYDSLAVADPCSPPFPTPKGSGESASPCDASSSLPLAQPPSSSPDKEKAHQEKELHVQANLFAAEGEGEGGESCESGQPADELLVSFDEIDDTSPNAEAEVEKAVERVADVLALE